MCWAICCINRLFASPPEPLLPLRSGTSLATVLVMWLEAAETPGVMRLLAIGSSCLFSL